ncbi:FAD dependent oxidoreductase superfamily [Grosmannia clavigera kw1407]|uniref:FAD dependent oxidoreductase superfamily n=1 Tax=Grosmannia clavigera (strain kw1407 / UAMH 11150) TaxID=655863 RepID=F0XBR2_GROCL|nr:FAD dependent oxidoreductase superfamily [Grosmannia clavigera kw1407]EFX05104.1 FAD dependent oxidoreductase superfamily [Grosmannia clavigera kw1407]
MANNNTHETGAPPLEVAVVGGGIIGVITAIGLLRRGINAVIYERASTWHEVSAGFAFTGAARVWMKQLDPALVELLSNISQKTDADTSNAYWNGYHPRTREDAEDESKSLLFRTPANNLSFWGCVRSHFLLGMAALLPEGTVKFRKQLATYDENPNGKVTLHFDDGTTAEADILLGCDGIHSSTRKVLLGADHPASKPGFSHTVVYEPWFPSTWALPLSETRLPSVPATIWVMSGTLLNIAVFAYDEPEFPCPDKMTVTVDRSEIEKLLKGWSPQIADIWKLYPEKVVKWGIFDLEDNPPPTYARGHVCLVGDAAHASTPYMGVGACTGVEDALVICTLLESVQKKALAGPALEEALTAALQTYTNARLERGKWVHHQSRQMGQMYHWRYGPMGRDPQRMKQQLEENWGKVVTFDVLAPLDPELRELAMRPSVTAAV